MKLQCYLLFPIKTANVILSLDIAKECFQQKALVYDRARNGHYDTISAFIKSMRGSDPDAALYWLAKMLKAGEDIRFIARRIMIFAAEDVGNADPRALMLATSALQAVEFVGMPEARIPLSQAVIYAACAPKSNASYRAIEDAMAAVEETATQNVPDHLRNILGPGEERKEAYKYPHDAPERIVNQDYLQKQEQFYFPTESGEEKILKERLDKWKELKKRKS